MVYDDEIGFEAGVQQLIQISRNPVILMGSKTSSLSQTLIGESIECTPPEISLSIGKLLIIALLEGGKNCTSISGKELSMLFKCLNMDIRKVLIQLQFLISSSNADLNLSSYGCNYPLLFFSIGVCPNSYMLFSNFLDCKQMSTISQWNYIPRVMRDIITPSQVHFNFTKKLATINSPQLLGDVSSFLDVLCWGDAFLDLEENMDSLSSILAFAEISKDMHLTALLLGYRNFSEAIGSSELNGWLFDQENIVNNHCGFLYEYFSMFNSHVSLLFKLITFNVVLKVFNSLITFAKFYLLSEK